MHANQTDIQKILGGVQQYVVPMFQRPYSWEARQWAKLWADVAELCDEPRNHFIGSIVTMPERSVPEGVSKFVLIDGQQRLTTMLVLLAAVRDKAAREGDTKLADKISDLMLKNRHQDDTDVYKLLPTQTDRAAFCAIMDGTTPDDTNGVAVAYSFFEKKLRSGSAPPLDQLYTVICKNLVLVSIVLDRGDNPYLIFESLNATGQPLTQADLIRNFVFMRVHSKQQDKVFRECWQPMQEQLGKHLTEFMRHFLMRNGRVVKRGEVYFNFKECVEERPDDDVEPHLSELARFSAYYCRLIDPSHEQNRELSSRVARLNRFEATTTYPFLLNVYHDHAEGRVSASEFACILDVLESYLIRRYVCGVPTNALSKIFVSLYSQARSAGTVLDGVRAALADKNFPRDQHFREHFLTIPLYGGGDRRDKAKLILDRLEASYEHKEAIDPKSLTIEHVMPQTLTDWWKKHLGDEWAATHEGWLDTVGNLTLTGYNPELSNSDFPTKRGILNTSHVELNRYFANVQVWDAEAIATRAGVLADRAIQIWPDVARPAEVREESTEQDEDREEFTAILDDVVDDMGGSVARLSAGPFRILRLTDGRIVNVKYSRSHGKYYWFGLHATLWADLQKAGASHVVLVLGTTGYAAVPIDTISRYVAEAGSSSKADGSVRHYHILVSTGPKPELFHNGKQARYPIGASLRPIPKKALIEPALDGPVLE
jgi:uncharacterized protein with ParB-like and HNH nuclease domain